jgi:hypothetical protein
LQPRHRLVQRALSGLKAYKSALAVLTTMASFTFLTSESVDSLHRQLLLRWNTLRHSAQATENASRDLRIMNQRAAWICYRLQVASLEERTRVAVELAQLPRAREEGWENTAAQHLSELLDEDLKTETGRLNQSGYDASASSGRSQPQTESQERPSTVSETDAQKVYSECRRAVTNVLSTLIKDQLHPVKFDNDLLSSFASDLLKSVGPAIPEAVLPENISELAAIRDWMSRHFSRRYSQTLINMKLEPNWDSLRQQVGISLPPIGVQIVTEAEDAVKEVEPLSDDAVPPELRPKLQWWKRMMIWVRYEEEL